MNQLPGNINLILPFLLWLQIMGSLYAEESSTWSDWSGWSKCLSQCGQGISVRNRLCRKKNENGQLTTTTSCLGTDVQRRLCLDIKCPKSGPSPRQRACSKYDNRVFSGKQYIWEPFMHLSDRCKLSCRAKDAHFYANLAERVQDGVECGQNGVLAVCIKGACQPVGCDNIILSTAKRDKCGRCGGDGTTCKTISGIFTSTQLTRGLNHVITIPSGSTGINITELMPSKNKLVLQTIAGNGLINADEDNPKSGSIAEAGTLFKYSPKTSISPRESILADGPTNITLVLKVLSRGSNPGIIYTFSVPHNVSDSYMKQITSRSVKALSVQAAPVYLEDDDTPKIIPYENDINEKDQLLQPSPVEEGGHSEVHKEVNFDESNHAVSSETPYMKSDSDEQSSVPSDGSLDPSGSAPAKNISLNTSKSAEENLHNISVSQSANTIGSQSVSESKSARAENISDNGQDDEVDHQNLEDFIDFKEGTNADRIISTEENQKDPDATVKVIDPKADMLDVDNAIKTEGEVTSFSPLSNNSRIISEPNLPHDNYLSPKTNTLKESQTLSPISKGSDFNDDLKTVKTFTSKPSGGFAHSATASKQYKIPKYSQSFTFAEKYKNRGRKRNRRRNSRRQGLSSRENGNRDNGGYSSRRRPVISQSPSLLENDDGMDTFNDQQSSGQQFSYPHRSEPRGGETSALESRPVTVRRYRYYGQRHSSDNMDGKSRSNDRMKSLRERQARIQARHRRLREQREEYNRRVRERHERQLKRRWQRARGKNSSQPLNQQRYTRVTVRSRPDFQNNYRGGLSTLETTTVVNVPSSSRLDVYSSQRRGSFSRSSSGSQERDAPVTPKRRFPIRIQPKPSRIIPNEVRSGREELVSRVSGSFPLSEKSTLADSSPSEHYVKTTSSQQIVATAGAHLEDTTASFSSEDKEIKNHFADIPNKNRESPTEDKEASSTILGNRRVIARVRSNQTNPSQVRRRLQPVHTLSRESEISPQVIPATRTNRDNVLIPNNHLRADQYQPDLIPNRQIPTNNIIGYTSYEWRISGLTECTHTCGGGVQQTVVVCVAERNQAVVTDENCVDVQKPELKAVTCNKRPCPAQWISSPWSACSVTCDEGVQTRSLFCQTRVSPTLNLTMPVTSCEHLNKPEETQICKTKSCNSWNVGNWSECSANCGDGVKTRTVQCVDVNQQAVADDECADLKPKEEQECNQGSCGKGWFVTQWPKECPVQCGKGELVRKVFCASDDGEALPESRCDANQRPRTHRPCRVDTPCGGSWFAGEWSKCNATCGKGWKTREILCVKKVPGNLFAVVEEGNCQGEYKPKDEEACILPDCEPEWYMTSWGQCSKSCETGYRTREIKCLSPQQAPSDQCSIGTRPRTREPCNTESCVNDSSEDDLSSADSDESCTDRYTQCRIVKRARLCRYGYYQKMCCKACTGES